MEINQVLQDVKIYMMISSNENYKERLLEAYYVLKENNVNDLETFTKSNLGIGAFSYSEITIFDRIKDTKYLTMLSSFRLELLGILNLSKDYGDKLASYGTIGKTPYREKYIKSGWITEGLTEEEKNKFYR